ncbi:MAG: DNA repair protein RecO [Anaerolineales bacterium]|nr:DNA repair protein RecO [Anaerolineales bacterium]
MTGRERVYRTEAIILRRQDFGEADRILTVLTPEYGKIRLLAKGARRPSSRKAGHLEPFTRVDLMVARGRNLDLVTQAESRWVFSSRGSDLVRFGCASYAAEALDRFTVEESESHNLYLLLRHTLERLEEDIDPGMVLRYFELELLDAAGFRPSLFQCVGCGEEIQPQDQFFSVQDGGVLCPACGKHRADALPVSLSALKVLRYFQREPFHKIAGLKLNEKTLAELELLLETYFNTLLERRLNTPAFIRQVEKLKQKRKLAYQQSETLLIRD